MGTGYLPASDDGLLSWATNAAAQFVANPTYYGLTPAAAEGYGENVGDYRAALDVARNEATRTKGNIQQKNLQKEGLVAQTRQLVRAMQSNPAVSANSKTLAGIPVHDAERTPVPAPEFAPDVDIKEINGRVVRVRLHNAETIGNRRKPEGVHGAYLFYCIGEAPSADPSQWRFAGSTTRTVADVVIAGTAATQVWISAQWINLRNEPGPSSVALPVSIPALSEMPAMQLKIAA